MRRCRFCGHSIEESEESPPRWLHIDTGRAECPDDPRYSAEPLYRKGEG